QTKRDKVSRHRARLGVARQGRPGAIRRTAWDVKPARSDYRKEDPIDQVYRLIREIKSGHFKDKTGREIKVQSERIPAYAYVICDTTKEVEIIAQNKGLWPTPDNLGYYGYNPA